MVEADPAKTALVRLERHRAKGAVAFDPVVPKGQLQPVEVGVVGRPEAGVVKGYGQLGRGCSRGLGGLGGLGPASRCYRGRLPVASRRCQGRFPAGRRQLGGAFAHQGPRGIEQAGRQAVPALTDLGGHTEQACVEVGVEVKTLDAGEGRQLQPDRLPDAALGGVPDAAPVQALLAPQLGPPVAGVPNAQGQLVEGSCLGFQCVGHV